jgi:hypothetical protein
MFQLPGVKSKSFTDDYDINEVRFKRNGTQTDFRTLHWNVLMLLEMCIHSNHCMVVF